MNPDELFAEKYVKEKEKKSKKEKVPEQTVEEEEWYIEDPDQKKDRVAFVKIHKEHEVTTKAS